jgi:hypothetical protein
MFNLNLDVIYALDTTGSMSSWINRSKRTIENISSDLSKQNIDTRFKVIGYKIVLFIVMIRNGFKLAILLKIQKILLIF